MKRAIIFIFALLCASTAFAYRGSAQSAGFMRVKASAYNGNNPILDLDQLEALPFNFGPQNGTIKDEDFVYPLLLEGFRRLKNESDGEFDYTLIDPADPNEKPMPEFFYSSNGWVLYMAGRYMQQKGITPGTKKVLLCPYRDDYKSIYISHMCFWPRTSSGNGVYDYSMDILFPVHVGQVKTEYAGLFISGSQPECVNNIKYMSNVELFSGIMHIEGVASINNYFGPSRDLSNFTVVPLVNEAVQLPFNGYGFSYARKNRVYEIGYYGRTDNYNMFNYGTMAEFFESIKLDNGNGNYCAWNGNRYDVDDPTYKRVVSWETYDSDGGGEPDAHEYYTETHDRDDPEDDFDEEYGNTVVDLSEQAQSFLDSQSQASLSALRDMLEGLGVGNNPGGGGGNMQETNGILNEVNGNLETIMGNPLNMAPAETPSNPTEDDFPEPEEVTSGFIGGGQALDDSLEDISDSFADAKSDWASGDGEGTDFSDFGTALGSLSRGPSPGVGQLPSFKLPIDKIKGLDGSATIGTQPGADSVYLNFNDLLTMEDGEVRSKFESIKDMISMFLWSLVIIFITYDIISLFKD